MGRPRTREGQAATTARLLLAAEVEFARRGFEGARLQDIAAQVGISRPSLLYHFGSKEALYEAVVRDVFTRIAAALASALEGGGPFAERLERVLAAFLAFLGARPSSARLILREVLDEDGPGHRLLLDAAVPVLELVERFMRLEGRGVLRPNLPIRAALLQIASSAFVKAGSGDLERAFWSGEDATVQLARLVFLGGDR